MLTPNQISSHRFFQTKQGYYKAEDVDEYMSLVYQTVCDLYDTNKQIQKRISGLTGDLEAYYKDRNSIAAAIIGAQTYANEKIEEADEKAKTIISEAVTNANEIFEEKKNEADMMLEKAQTALDDALENAEKKAQEYIDQINKKASEIITNANEQASKIVSRAFADAKKAKDTCDDIINGANEVLPAVSQDISVLKMHLQETFESILNMVDSIDVPDEISIERTAIDEEGYVVEEEPAPASLTLEEVEPVEEIAEEIAEEASEETEEPEAEEIAENSEPETEEKSVPTLEEEITDLFSSSKSIDELIDKKLDFDDLFSIISDNSEE